MNGSNQELHKQVETPVENAELAGMKSRIAMMQWAYLALFITSLVLLVYDFGRHTQTENLAWAITLGSAVVVRLIRQSMVNKYNAILMGNRPSPLS